MSIIRYKIPLIITFIILMIFSLITIIFSISGGQGGFIAFSPINNMGFDTFLILIIAWISAFIGGVLPGYILGPLLLLVHKYTIGLRMEYGIQKREQTEKFKGTFRGFFPVLMTFNFALLFSQNPGIQQALVGSNNDFSQALAFNVLLSILVGISLAVFSAVWFLLDGGIVYTNRTKVKESTFPVEVRGVGSWLNYLLKGYAGISVLFSYYQILSGFIQIQLSGAGFEISSIIFLITWPLMPLLYTLIVSPIFMILDKTYEHRKKYIQKFANRLNITGPLEDPLNIEL
ncbi:MAG: hypothetical protein GF317_21940 [Candidatus Lokiarchaeota archaeon]|nr:hypothetical protein [Candidatus Lokiarchaeota archaeon]MBD3202121.1 hypothetical protein [Candidatus Lokiarchaeota archaeon]